MNLFTSITLALAPRTLFLCKKCQRSPDSIEAEVSNGELKVTAWCHGQELTYTVPADSEANTPVEIAA